MTRPQRRSRPAAALLVALICAAAGAVGVRAATSQRGGVVLDGYGGLHPFGALSLDTSGAPYWPGFDIARAVTVKPDGSGGWELDGYGGIHAFGSAGAITRPAYWPYTDFARDMVVLPGAGGNLDGGSGYVLDGYGGIHPWGGAPVLSGAPYTRGHDVARGLAVHTSGTGAPDGGWLLDADGSIHAFGAAPALGLSLPHDDVHLKLHVLGNGASGWAVAQWGITTTFGGVSPDWSGYSDWSGWAIQRDIQLLQPSEPSPVPEPSSAAAVAAYRQTLQPHGGAVLDGYGGIHPFDAAFLSLNTAHAPYWPNWDIARALTLRGDGSGGWELDGFGGIHAFGGAAPISTPGYWPYWDIARDMVVTSRDAGGEPDGKQGYLLDGFGGIHPWGGAPALGSGVDPWPGFDIARGLAIHEDATGTPDGAWVMDVFGGIHTVGKAPAMTVWSGGKMPLWRHLHAQGTGFLVVGRNGVTTTSGQTGQPFWGVDYATWGGWDIERDVVVINPAAPVPQSQPVGSAALAAFSNVRFENAVPLYAQQHPLDCESAALQMALAAHGTSVSQDWIIAVVGADTRPAVKDQYGNILQWGDPYQTFVGNVNGSEPLATGYGVYYPSIAYAARQTGQFAMAQEGWRSNDLYAMVAAGYPAVVWVPFEFAGATTRYWTAWDGASIRYIRNEHAVTLVGVDYNAGMVTINDPEYGVKNMSMAFFEGQWSYLDDMAAVIS